MKTALITGCNRGLGLTLLKKFAGQGYDIIASSRKQNENFDACCKDLESRNNIKITHVYFDLTNKEEVKNGLEKISNMDVEIDVLINNAGVNNIVKPLMYLEYEDMENTFMVNYFTPVMITREVAMNMMRQSKGSIINITSMMAGGHQPCGTCYDASKAALNQFTKSIAQELAPLGIRVNAISCGVMDTGMSENLNEKAHKKLIKASAMKRPADTAEIAETALFLASDKASYITGSIINVDGGSVI